jgi:hypothetical protein
MTPATCEAAIFKMPRVVWEEIMGGIGRHASRNRCLSQGAVVAGHSHRRDR